MSSYTSFTLLDTSLRDGLQHEQCYISNVDRLRILNALLDAGVKKIEIASFSHPEYIPQFKEVESLLEILPERDDVEYSVLALNQKAAERVVDAIERGARIDCVMSANLATSESYAKLNMNRTQEELFKDAERMVKFLHDHGIKKVKGNVGTVFGCPIEGLVPLERAYEFCERMVDIGFDEIEHSDTDGNATPEKVAEYCDEIIARFPNPEMHSLHIHDIYGVGITSYYEAIKHGFTQFECALGGIGGQPANILDGVPVKGTGESYYPSGRTGLVSTEDFACLLNKMNYKCGIDADKIISAGKLLEKILGRKLNSFAVSHKV